MRVSIFVWLSVAAFLLSAQSDSTSSFEGVISFTTDISVTDRAPDGLKERLADKYGTGMKMYYSEKGLFRRTHINNADGQVESQYYLREKESLVFTYRNSPQVETVDVGTNTLKLIRRERLADEKIAGYDCECYEYDATSSTSGDVVLEFCFSKSSPAVNPEFWDTHRDFFLDDFFALAKRPYLRYKLKTKVFSLNMTATSLEKMPLQASIFRFD